MSKEKPKTQIRTPPPAPSIEKFVSGGVAPSPAPATPAQQTVVTTTFRITAEQLAWLQQEALDRKTARGGRGKADASEVLREILAERMAGQS